MFFITKNTRSRKRIPNDNIIRNDCTVVFAVNPPTEGGGRISRTVNTRPVSANYVIGYDQLYQSSYLDNSDVFNVMYNAMTSCSQAGLISIASGQTLSGNPIDLTSIVNTSNATNLVYTVTQGNTCPVQTIFRGEGKHFWFN